MNEQWIHWNPLTDLANKYYIKSISEDFENGFKIILSDADKKKKNVLIHFPHSVNAYRRTDETFTLIRTDYLSDKYSANYYINWTFFKITNSEYLEWLAEQSKGIAEPPYYNFIHYCIVTDEEIFDIACTYEPTVTFLD